MKRQPLAWPTMRCHLPIIFRNLASTRSCLQSLESLLQRQLSGFMQKKPIVIWHPPMEQLRLPHRDWWALHIASLGAQKVFTQILISKLLLSCSTSSKYNVYLRFIISERLVFATIYESINSSNIGIIHRLEGKAGRVRFMFSSSTIKYSAKAKATH